jgi:molecular chaperone GrpE
MSDAKGPRVEVPPELTRDLEGSESAGAPVESGPVEDVEPEIVEPAVAGPAGEGDAQGAGPLEALQVELDQLRDKYLRMAAEHENQRRRLQKEQQTALQFANEALIKDLLGTVDNLERALDHARTHGGAEATEGGDANLLAGVELTLRSMLGVLGRHGVDVVDEVGIKFDPRLHEAMRQEVREDCEPGTVIELYQKGYRLRGRLLRPAMVAVSAAGEKEPSESVQ